MENQFFYGNIYLQGEKDDMEDRWWDLELEPSFDSSMLNQNDSKGPFSYIILFSSNEFIQNSNIT